MGDLMADLRVVFTDKDTLIIPESALPYVLTPVPHEADGPIRIGSKGEEIHIRWINPAHVMVVSEVRDA